MKTPTIRLEKTYKFGQTYYYPTDELGKTVCELASTKHALMQRHVECLQKLGIPLDIELTEE